MGDGGSFGAVDLVSEPALEQVSEQALEEATDFGTVVAELRRQGADRTDPVRFRFIEALSRRTATQQGAARRILNGRLAIALQDFSARFETALRDAGATAARAEARHPAVAEDLRRLVGTGDFDGLRRFVGSLDHQIEGSPLGDLVRALEREREFDSAVPPAGVGTAGVVAADRGRPELKSVRHFRSDWSRLSVDRQIAEAIAQGPRNAGPLNSHQLILQSLKSMRSLSPEYLDRFMSYADAMLWLDSENGGGAPTDKTAARVPAEKKRRAHRVKAR